MAARSAKRSIRSHKLKPYRAAAVAEKKAVKANADFLYQKALHDNPALAHSNPVSRFWQKQRIKKQYAKTLKAGSKVKKTAEATAKAAKKTAQETKRATFFVVRHWKGCLIVGGIAFIVLLLFGGLSSCSLFGGNSGSGLIASSYLSEDADITGAESAYAAMEAELQDMLDNIESEYPGYDEYRVNADEIEHDPYVLISILSAWHEGVFTLDEVQSTLEMLFEKQYILTVEEEVQVRYRTETRTDSEGNPYTVEVPYNYYILHVDLENFTSPMSPFTSWAKNSYPCTLCICRRWETDPTFSRNPAMCLNTMKTRPPIMKYPPRCWVPMKSLRGSWRKQINTSVFPMCGAAAPRKPLLIAAAL